jgi:hypothetical protein
LTILFHFNLSFPQKKEQEKKPSESFLPTLHTRVFLKRKENQARRAKASFLDEREEGAERRRRRRGNKSGNKKGDLN